MSATRFRSRTVSKSGRPENSEKVWALASTRARNSRPFKTFGTETDPLVQVRGALAPVRRCDRDLLRARTGFRASLENSREHCRSQQLG